MSLTGPALAGVALIAVATLAGAWLAGRASRPPGSALPGLALAGAAAVLAAVVLADLVPDIWRDLPASGLPWWAAAAALAAAFAAADALARRGCACRAGPGSGRAAPGSRRAAPGSGRAVAAALVVHRALEGGAVALTGSAAVIAALAVHAAAEGFALAVLLRGERRDRAAALLALACLSPAAGAVVLSQFRLPGPAAPVLTCMVAGVLLRTAAGAWQLGRTGSAAGIARRRDSDLGAGSEPATVRWHPEPARLGQPTRAD
jgi:zinc transporter ZupT